MLLDIGCFFKFLLLLKYQFDIIIITKKGRFRYWWGGLQSNLRGTRMGGKHFNEEEFVKILVNGRGYHPVPHTRGTPVESSLENSLKKSFSVVWWKIKFRISFYKCYQTPEFNSMNGSYQTVQFNLSFSVYIHLYVHSSVYPSIYLSACISIHEIMKVACPPICHTMA